MGKIMIGGPDSDESALEAHVDEMMDPKRPNQAAGPVLSTDKYGPLPGAPDMEPIDIFAGKSDKKPVYTDSARSKLESSKTLVEEDAASAEDSTSVPPAEQQDPEASGKEPELIPGTDQADNPADDKLVDDIISNEGNQLLAVQDAEIAKAFVGPDRSFWERVKDGYFEWWDNKLARYGTLTGLLLIIAGVAIMPAPRYFVLNTAGMRTAATVRVMDSTTNLPLKNVSVSLAGTDVKTDANGFADLYSVRFGTQQLTVQQIGFATISKTVTLGLGGNELGELSLKATGIQFRFAVTDYISGKPVTSATASSGDNDAKADKTGTIVLTIGRITGPTMDVQFTADGYRDEKVTITTGAPGMTTLTMVSKRPEVYVTKQSGTYDVYKSDLDGKNKKLLLAGTGIERPQISLISNQNDDTAALVSSRDDKRDQDGYLLDTLTLINLGDGSTTNLDSSERIQLVDWIGDRLVYIKIKAGTSAGNSQRYQLISYDLSNTNRQVLASANYFNDIVSAKGVIYFASSNNYYPGGQSQFVRVNPDATNKQVLQTAEVFNILRNSYDNLDLAGQNKWYSYHLGDTSAKEAAQPPADTNDTRFYLDGPDGKHSLWTESRDGKGTLLVYDNTTGKDTPLAMQSGLTYPLQWLDDRTVVYRVQTPQETAAYVVSLDGGKPKKISDVTDTFGFGKFGYYY